MARSRNIKPGFFKNEMLAELDAFDRLLFIGLWCLADREGRIENRPKRIKMELFPCDDYQVESGLAALHHAGFIERYNVGEIAVIEVVNFAKHQSPHGTEKDSELPDCHGYLTVHERGRNGCVTGQQRKVNVAPTLINVNPPLDNALIPDSLIPDSLIPDSLIPDSLIPEKEPLVPSADDTDGYSSEFEACWAKYPKRAGGNPKRSAWKAWKARLRAGVSAEELTRAVERYAAELLAKGKLGSEYVKQAATFFGPDEHWREALASNLHALPAGRDASGKLQAGFYYHPDDNGLPAEKRRVINGATHDPATGYSLDYLRRKGML